MTLALRLRDVRARPDAREGGKNEKDPIGRLAISRFREPAGRSISSRGSRVTLKEIEFELKQYAVTR